MRTEEIVIPDYKEIHFVLARAAAWAEHILIEAQQRCEDLFLDNGENETPTKERKPSGLLPDKETEMGSYSFFDSKQTWRQGIKEKRTGGTPVRFCIPLSLPEELQRFGGETFAVDDKGLPVVLQVVVGLHVAVYPDGPDLDHRLAPGGAASLVRMDWTTSSPPPWVYCSVAKAPPSFPPMPSFPPEVSSQARISGVISAA